MHMNYCLPLQILKELRTKGPRNQAFVLSSPTFTGTQTSSCVHPFFFVRPTNPPTFTRGRAMGNETFYWDGLIGHSGEWSWSTSWLLIVCNNLLSRMTGIRRRKPSIFLLYRKSYDVWGKNPLNMKRFNRHSIYDSDP